MMHMSNRHDHPCVSVIIPTRNRVETFLPRAAKSVLVQTEADLELIIVDDASTDGTAEFVKSLGDPRIKYLQHSKCAGQCAARNTGLEAAKGDFVAFLDDDDEWMPHKLEVQLRAFDESPEFGLIYSGWLWVFQEINTVERKNVPDKKGLIRGYHRWFHNVCVDTLIRTDLVRAAGGYNEALVCYEHTDLLIRLTRLCRFGHVRDVLAVCWSHHGIRVSNSSECLANGIDYLLANYRDFIRVHRKAWAEFNLRLGALKLQALYDTADSREKLLASVKAEPFRKTAWAYVLASLLPSPMLRGLSRYFFVEPDQDSTEITAKSNEQCNKSALLKSFGWHNTGVPAKRVSVAAIVVTYLREKLLLTALEAIVGQSRPPDAVIVIDNGPTGETEESVRRRFPQVIYSRLGENKGPAGGFAAGLKIAYEHGHDWFWLFDDDCRPEGPNCLEALLAHQRDHPALGIIRPVVKDPSTGNVAGAGPWSGALFSRDVVGTVGFPKEDLFFGSEDIEYASRILRQGFTVIKCEDVIVFHNVPSRRTWSSVIRKGYVEPPWRLYYEVRNLVWLQTRRHPFIGFLRSFNITTKILILSMLFGKFRVTQSWMTLNGFIDGVMGRLGRRAG